MTVGSLSPLLVEFLARRPVDRGFSVLEVGILDDGLSALLDGEAGARLERFVAIGSVESSQALVEALDDRGHDLMRIDAARFAKISTEAFDLILVHAPYGPYPWLFRLSPGGIMVLEGNGADPDSQSFLRVSSKLIDRIETIQVAWQFGATPTAALAIHVPGGPLAAQTDLLGTCLGIPIPADDPHHAARALGVNAHSVFEYPAERDRIAFVPAEATPEWKLTVRSTLWHEDIDTRNRLIQELIRRDFGGDPDYQHLVENGWVCLSAPLGDIDDIVVKADRLYRESSIKDERYRGASGERYQYVPDPVLKLPELSRLLENQRINHLVRRYMGDDAIYSFGLLENMPAGVDVYDASGLWHHDKVGNRLKAFFLLCDVTPEGRPTYFVSGSHLLDWPDYHYHGSRFSDQWVRHHFDVVSLTGKKGDVVLIDTNALHRGNYEHRTLGRQAFVAEYSNPLKSWKLDCIGAFPVGVKPQRLPLGLDVDKTLLDRTELVRDGDSYAYGHVRLPGILPNFN